MPRRLTEADRERIIREVRESENRPPIVKPTIRAMLSCGHEDEIPEGMNPAKAFCRQCIQDGMRSK
jgi:hypothetical protein